MTKPLAAVTQRQCVSSTILLEGDAHEQDIGFLCSRATHPAGVETRNHVDRGTSRMRRLDTSLMMAA